MQDVGKIPNDISVLTALNSIGENILIADMQFHIRWMNCNASDLLTLIAPLYQLENSEDFIGKSMDYFHQRPERQQGIMQSIKSTHRTRITIKDRFVTDIVVTPIINHSEEIDGYIIMLMDVSTKAEEEKNKEKLIKTLSIPILHVWESTIALPLIGEFNAERSDLLLTSVLFECSSHRIENVIIDLSGVLNFDQDIQFHIQKLHDCLKLIGARCILVGIKPELAISMGALDRDVQIYSSTHAGLEMIINQHR
jgi:anti-anti-sigma regulatory factor